MRPDTLPLCRHCGKPADAHQVQTACCPGGRKNRTHGYPWFWPYRKFEPKLDTGTNPQRIIEQAPEARKE